MSLSDGWSLDGTLKSKTKPQKDVVAQQALLGPGLDAFPHEQSPSYSRPSTPDDGGPAHAAW